MQQAQKTACRDPRMLEKRLGVFFLYKTVLKRKTFCGGRDDFMQRRSARQATVTSKRETRIAVCDQVSNALRRTVEKCHMMRLPESIHLLRVQDTLRQVDDDEENLENVTSICQSLGVRETNIYTSEKQSAYNGEAEEGNICVATKAEGLQTIRRAIKVGWSSVPNNFRRGPPRA